MKGIEQALEENSKIPLTASCPHPAAEIIINTGDAPPHYVKQYPLSNLAKRLIRVDLELKERQGVITKAPFNSPYNNPLTVANLKTVASTLADWDNERWQNWFGKHFQVDMFGPSSASNPVDISDDESYKIMKKGRVCFDARFLNKHIPKPPPDLANMNDVFATVSGFFCCSALDLSNAYNSLPIRKEDQIKTTFTFGRDRYMYKRGCFGLSSLPFLFQKLMLSILDGCQEFCFNFLDDIFVYSKSIQDHITHLNIIIARLTKYNFHLNRIKSKFGYKALRLLGSYISGNQLHPDPAKIDHLQDIPKPKTGQQMMAFLGLVGFLRPFVPHISSIQAPLDQLRYVKSITTKHWTSERLKAFELIKLVFKKSLFLERRVTGYPLIVSCDSSIYGIGACLFQHYNGKNHFIELASRSLTSTQQNYGSTKREVLALVFALKRFHSYLAGVHFFLMTDHKPLLALQTQSKLSRVLEDWIDEINHYSFTLIHCPGILLQVPDDLSRLYYEYAPHVFHLRPDRQPTVSIPVVEKANTESVLSDVPNTTPTIDSKPLKAKEEKRRTLRLFAEPSSRHRNRDRPQEPSRLQVAQDTLEGRPIEELKKLVTEGLNKEFVPEEKRQELLHNFHAVGHFSADELYKQVWSSGKFWPTLRKDCIEYVAKCRICCTYNVAQKGFHPMKHTTAKFPFDHIAIDLAEVEGNIRGYKYILVIIDIATKFVILRALKDKSAVRIAQELWKVFSLLGVPKVWTSDNEFNSEVISELNTFLYTQHKTVTPYAPRSNSHAERAVKTVKTTLFKMLDGRVENWDLMLDSIQWAVNCKTSRSTKTTPFFLFFGRKHNQFDEYIDCKENLLTEDDLLQHFEDIQQLIYPRIQFAVDKANKNNKEYFKKRHKIIKRIPPGSTVLVYDIHRRYKSQPTYLRTPMTVIDDKTNHGNYRLRKPDGTLFPRPVAPYHLKVVKLVGEDGETYEVDKILKHRGPRSKRQYLVKWKGYSTKFNSWIKEDDFVDPLLVRQYYRRLQEAKQSRENI